MSELLMPKATAVWLVDNTALTFQQIAAFCGLHDLEVQGIADGEVAVGIRGLDPVTNDQLTRDEIVRCEQDKSQRLNLNVPSTKVPQRTRRARYTPVSKRQDRPNAIAWLIKNYPELNDAQIGKLLGTTKSTITAVRERTHWNTQNIAPHDPLLLGICSESELLEELRKARRRQEREEKKAAREAARKAAAKLAASEAAAASAPAAIPPETVSAPEPASKPAPAPAPEPEVESATAPEADKLESVPTPDAESVFGERSDESGDKTPPADSS